MSCSVEQGVQIFQFGPNEVGNYRAIVLAVHYNCLHNIIPKTKSKSDFRNLLDDLGSNENWYRTKLMIVAEAAFAMAIMFKINPELIR